MSKREQEQADFATMEARAVALSLPLFEGLTHVVQVQVPGTKARAARWETIAAFNVERVAVAYAEAAIASPHRPKGQLYRVCPTMLEAR